MRLLPARTHRAMPWKNGGGETLEIAVFPPGTPADTCDWRVSMARVPASGAFSCFPSIERTLAVLAGRMILRVDGRPEVLLSAATPPYSFAGEARTDALVLDPVVDLNVMVRRGRAAAAVWRAAARERFAATHETLVVLRSAALLATGEALAADDVIWLGAGETVTFARPFTAAWAVEIHPV